MHEAHTHGVTQVLPHVLWDAPDEASTLAEWVEDHVLPAPHGQKSP